MNDQNPQQTFVRAPVAPPQHVRYAHEHGRGMLTFEQMDQLVMAINQAYVMRKQNNTYLSQHQARAEMNRIFGYLNWDSEVLSMDLEYEERMLASEQPRHPSFPKNGKADVYWICAYKAKVQVTIRDLWGMPLAVYSEYHIEENAPQPNRGEARALAATSVESYALRRALINMGDRFGLGLYNGGSMAPHGQYTQQLFPGQLFNWVDPSAPDQVQRVAPAVTHQTIQAEQAIADDVQPQQWEQPQQEQQPTPQQQPVQQQAPVQQQQQQVQQQIPQHQQPGGMQEFHQAQQTLQENRQQARQQAPAPMPQFDPNMLARVQGGFKTDGGQ
ncbi:DNA recombinase [Microbacterium phage RubyRalph]|nr:DNA recombinase [Microbacterium phage RubyRalph]